MVTGKIDVLMLLILTSWNKSTKCEAIKCIGQKQSKGDKKWIPNRTPNKPVNSYHSYKEGDWSPDSPRKKFGGIRFDISVFMFGKNSQCLCWAHIHRMFLCHNIWQQHFKTNRTATLLIISLKSEMLWGGGGALNNLQYVLKSVDGYRPGKVWKKHPL